MHASGTVRLALSVLIFTAMGAGAAGAQPAQDVQALRQELEGLKALVSSLESRLSAIESGGAAVAKPAAAAAPAVQPPEAETAGGQRPQATELLQQHDTMRNDESAAPRIDNVPIDPEMRGFVRLPGTETRLRIGGYAKLDAIYDLKPAGDPDMFITSTIPTGPTLGLDSFNLHIRQTRLNLDLRRPTADGRDLRVFVESDFYGLRPNLFRMRHAYGQWRNLLVGQSFTTFSDVDAMGDTLDFEGPPNTVFALQPQIRFTWALPSGQSLAASIEKPTTEVRSGSIVTPRTPAPDGVVRWRIDRDRGHLAAAALVRSVAGYIGTEMSESLVGWGLNLTGSALTAGRDTAVFEVVYGRGIGRYLNDTGGLVLEAGIDNGRWRTVPLFGINGSYQHYWTEHVRSSLTYGFLNADNLSIHEPETFHRSQYVAGNLLFAPTRDVMIGAEVLYGRQQTKSGETGNATRVQLGLQYNFVKR